MVVDNAHIVLYGLLTILGAWSICWLITGLYKSQTDKEHRYYWLTHAVWVTVNLTIFGFGLFAISNATLDTEFVTLQRNIVAVNALLDIGYMAVAKYLQKTERPNRQQIGKAIFIQGLFLLILDSIFAVIFTLLLL